MGKNLKHFKIVFFATTEDSNVCNIADVVAVAVAAVVVAFLGDAVLSVEAVTVHRCLNEGYSLSFLKKIL
jgi:hypothetical protein